ncbi:MAG: dihydropteroate synthase [Chitinophagales bacterium]
MAKPIIMGIINYTPDSFYDGGAYANSSAAIAAAEKMLAAGSTIIDVGGMSSRPGAAVISPQTEIERVVPLVTQLAKEFPESIISIDTVYGIVAQACADVGAKMINDISAGSIDAEIVQVAAAYQLPYVLMHMQGLPQSMQQSPTYDDILVELVDFFVEKIAYVKSIGVNEIVLDVGFGFGKSIEHNFTLLKNLSMFKELFQLPVLAGLSRKSMIWKTLQTTPRESLNGTTVCNTLALWQGADILRVHDVAEACETLKLWQMFCEA